MVGRVAAALTLFLLLVPATRAPVACSPELAARVDKVFERMDKPTSPGCALAVIRDGRVVYTRGYGMANLDHDIPITATTVFHVASGRVSGFVWDGSRVRHFRFTKDRGGLATGAEARCVAADGIGGKR